MEPNDYYILIDESGTLPDKQDKHIVVAGVCLKELREARDIIRRVFKSLQQEKKQIQELKFYYAGERTKKRVLSGIVSAGFDAFTLIVDKEGRKIPDTPQNFALLVSVLIKEIRLWKSEQSFRVVIDKHFHRRVDEEKFNTLLMAYIEEDVVYSIQHVDSRQYQIVNIADFVAGANLAKCNKGDLRFFDVIKKNVLSEKTVSWTKLRRENVVK